MSDFIESEADESSEEEVTEESKIKAKKPTIQSDSEEEEDGKLDNT